MPPERPGEGLFRHILLTTLQNRYIVTFMHSFTSFPARPLRSGGVTRGLQVSTLIAAFCAFTMFVAPTAAGSAVPTSPGDGTTTAGSRPILSWQLPAGEQSSYIAVGQVPLLVVEDGQIGLFGTGGVGQASRLEPGDRSWQPTFPLTAGQYSWAIESTAGGVRQLGSVMTFTVPARGRITKPRIRIVHGLLRATFVTRTNLDDPVAQVRIWRGHTLIANRTIRIEPDLEHNAQLQRLWIPKQRTRVRPGVRYRMTIVLSGDEGFATKATTSYRAP